MIVICEPFYRGVHHVPFNAALVNTVAEAFPEEGLIFCAEREHLNNVRRVVAASVPSVRFVEVKLPERVSPEGQRGRRFPIAALLKQFAFCRRIFRLADKNQASRIVFCSAATRNELISIKAMLRRFPQIFCLVVLHQLQTTIRAPQAKGLTLKFISYQHLSYQHWLLTGNTPKIHYVVPGPPPLMEQGLKKYLPRMNDCISPVDHPYVFADSAGSEPFKDTIIRFGFYGHASLNKGADIFFKVANEVSSVRTKYRPEFFLIGNIQDMQLKEMPLTSVIIPSPNAPLSRGEFDKYGQSIDYALFFHTASAYELNGTAAMLDAFSYLKPLIALKTPLSEYYFNKMGDIGYLCESYEDVKNAILDVLETKPIDRYRVQQDNILANRGQFSPAGIAPEFRVLLRQNVH